MKQKPKDIRVLKNITVIFSLLLMSLVFFPSFIGNFGGRAIGVIACTDTDKGTDYYLQGITTPTTGKVEKDFCSGNILSEFSCDKEFGAAKKTSYPCTYGCKDGACSQEPSCIDSDNGIDYFNQGAIETSSSPIPIIDWCKDLKTLTEYYCTSSKQARFAEYECPNGCKDGACLPKSDMRCIDSDNGNDYYTSGKITGINKEGAIYDLADFCSDDYQLNEYYCYNSEAASVPDYYCTYGCKDGACVNLSKGTCVDSDGIDYIKKGSASGIIAQGYGKTDTIYDSCSDNNTLLEAYCNTDLQVAIRQYNCLAGCSDGICLPEDYSRNTSCSLAVLAYDECTYYCHKNKAAVKSFEIRKSCYCDELSCVKK